MNENLYPENTKEFLKKQIHKNIEHYGLGYIKCAIIKEKGEKQLYLADVKIQHKDDIPIEELIHEYDNAILATIPFTIDELLMLIDNLGTEQITIKTLKNVNAKGGFENSCYHISSRTRHAGFYNEWPSFCFRFSLEERTHLDNVYKKLIKPGLPAYPEFYEACNAFFRHENRPNQNTPVHINFLIPDYKARIKMLEIADKQISLLIEKKDESFDNLSVQIYCKKGEKQFQNSNDLKLDLSGSTKFIPDFVPDNVFTYLLDQKNESTLDAKIFGRYYSDRTDGIIVKTSVGSLETMIAKGENQQVEFKLDLDKEKNEFLESIVAFANTNDGTILLGVDNDGKIVGFFEDFDRIDKKIRGLVSGHCEPDIEINVEEVLMENRTIIVVKVKEGKNKPYLLAGKSAYKRVEKDDLTFKRLDFDNISSKKEKNNYQQQIGL